jgi:hypothetical protein
MHEPLSVAHRGLKGYRFVGIVTVDRDLRHVGGGVTTQVELIFQSTANTCLLDRGVLTRSYPKCNIGLAWFGLNEMGLCIYLLSPKQVAS